MLSLDIKDNILEEGTILDFKGAVLEMKRYQEQEIQVNTYIYLERDGVKYQFITYNHCDVQKNISLEKQIVIEKTEEYIIPDETRKNQILYYLPGNEHVAISKLSQRRNMDYFDGTFKNDNVFGCEYFAFLRENGDNDYMVLLSTKNLKNTGRLSFLKSYGIDELKMRNVDMFREVLAVNSKIKYIGSYLGIVKISDIYATETKIYFEKEGIKYQYTCLEKFNECREQQIHNTRFYRYVQLCEVDKFELPDEDEYAMMDCYIAADDGECELRKMGTAQYGRYVPFEEKKVNVTGCRYFAAVIENIEEADSENVIYMIVEACRKTRYKRLKNAL